ncbi:MFS transporter [Kribbella amoyensis]|uniref:MFS transporter n=1 Tax=Kribbella amoyensis TaxID=996641 RepID=A0A561BN85_9ACTN|nr:MFS transporter [Kribbella amoyensis]TWD80317.1 MFS transporter [Kribbella amoyensis]
MTAYYRWLAGASLSSFGDAAVFFALGWAATGIGPHVAGLVLTAFTVPRAVLLLAGGVLGDRWGPRRVLLSGYTALAVATAVLAVVIHVLGTTTAVLLATALTIGVVDAFTLPAAGAFPRLFARDGELAKLMALRASTNQVITLTAGPINGVLVAAAGLVGALFVDATTFAVAALILLVTHPPYRVSAPPRQSALHQAVDGLRLAASDAVLRPLLLTVALVAGFVLPVTSLCLPLLARSRGWSASTTGLLVGATAAAGLLVTLAVARFGTFRRPGFTAAVGCVVAALGIAGLAFVPWLAVPAAFVQGFGVGLFTSHLQPLFVAATPASHLTRLQSILSLAQTIPLLLTTNLLGVLAGHSVPLALTVCAAATALAGLLLLVARRW